MHDRRGWDGGRDVIPQVQLNDSVMGKNYCACAVLIGAPASIIDLNTLVIELLALL